jgi:DNA-binding GntR family transcriptional regulator
MLELYAIREVLSGAAARLASQHAAPYEVLALKQMIHSHQDIASADDAAEANRQLHAAIVAATHNEYLRRCTTVLSDALALLGPTTYSVPGRIQSGWEENARIVEAIARHDADAAEAEARQHIRAACAVRLAMHRTRSRG